MMAKEIRTLTIDPALQDSFSMEQLKNRSFTAGQPYRLDHHQVMLVVRGRGTLRIDGMPVPLSGNSLILVSKGQVCVFGENRVTGYLLQFGDCFWQRTPASANNCKAVLFDDSRMERRLQLRPDNRKELDKLLATLLQEFIAADYANKPDVLAAYLKVLIIKIANIYALLKEDTGSYDNKLYREFTALVRQECRTVHDVATFAQQLGVSPRKLSEICRRFGNGAKEIINAQLVAEAKRLLQFTSQSIKEISIHLSFATPYQFSHFFKKHTRLSPAAYRRRFVKIGI